MPFCRSLRDVRPLPPRNHATNRVRGHAVRARKREHGATALAVTHPCGSNRSHIGFGELGVALFAACDSILRHHVSDVVLMCAFAQMGWIDALRAIARVHGFHALANRASEMQAQRYAVNELRAFTIPHGAIARSVDAATPINATVWTHYGTARDYLCKSFLSMAIDLRWKWQAAFAQAGVTRATQAARCCWAMWMTRRWPTHTSLFYQGCVA